MKLEVVRIKGYVNWAVKATADNGVSRYRGYYYKRDAVAAMKIWCGCGVDQRNFYHNFYEGEKLGIK